MTATVSTGNFSSITELTNLDEQNDEDEKCDIIIINPCYGLRFYPTDLISLSSFACDGDDDTDRLTLYENINPLAATSNLARQMRPLSIDPVNVQYEKMKNFQQTKSEMKITVSFPLHEQCAKGNLKEIVNLIDEKKYNPMQPDQDKWHPIHHAAWNGHDEVIKLLLRTYSCSPNVRDNFSMTALHYAALQGHVEVLKVLLDHSDIDVTCKNHEGKTCLNMCEGNPKKDWLECAELIKTRMNAPVSQINVRLMDGSTWNIDLISGSNTTAHQLMTQIIQKLELANEYGNVFAIWICSKNLQLQLKGDHKPLEHLADWKRIIIPQFTDVDPSREEASLFFKRDARLVLRNERKVRHPWAIRLLCFEAYHNYINSMYPCSENDVVQLAALFMEITNDDFDVKKWKAYLAEEKNLQLFIPNDKLRRKNASYWSKLILKEYESKYASMENSIPNDIKLQYKFLVCCWNLTIYGSAFFQGSYQANKNKFQPIYVCVNDVGIHLVNKQTKTLELSFSYVDIYWTVNTQSNILEIKIKGSKNNSTAVIIYTKQSILINHLMSKLESHIHQNDGLQ